MRARKWGRDQRYSIAGVEPRVADLVEQHLARRSRGFLERWRTKSTDGITVNNILPGYTRTERVEHLPDATAAKEGVTRADVVARFERETPMRRLGEPAEFAALAVFLASQQASYITGQSIAVDGGWIKSLM
jgi:3-oxoacyl-[acyl-carrier protein] reductase